VELNIGKKIKKLRKSLELTQEELAERANLTKGFISQVENNLTSLSIESLLLILKAMDITPAEFFAEMEKKIVYKPKDFTELERKGVKSWKLLIPGSSNKEMEPVLLELEPGQKTEEENGHYGEEFGYVISGRILLHLGEDTHKVGKGQCFYFEANQKHYIENIGKGIAKFLWVSAPPSF